jgi:uncharacterized BrkB/YihY/UPF0761 family membrane protein
MAFFSILTVIPTLVFVAIGTGLVLAVVRSDLLTPVQNWLAGILDDAGLSRSILQGVTGTVCTWDEAGSGAHCDIRGAWDVIKLSLGAVVLVAYSGGNWLRHLRRALNMIWRDDADDTEASAMILVRWAKNIGQFLVFASLILLSLATSTLATNFSRWLLTQLKIAHTTGGVYLIRLGAVGGALLVGWCLFVFVLRAIPSYNQPFGSIARGALLGSVAWLVIQQVSSRVIVFFRMGQTATVFGPIFVVLLVFNIFSQVTLFVAAWTATTGYRPRLKRVRVPRRKSRLDDVDLAASPVTPG